MIVPNFYDEALTKVHTNIQYTETPAGGKTSAWDDDNNLITLDDSAIATEKAKLEAEWTAQEYARNRQADYPDMGSQLNKIYDDGITKWKSEMVDPVKAKWPKDNSGPK